MDPALDIEARRLFVSTALTTQAVRCLGGRIPPGSDTGDLLRLARRLEEEMAPVERRYALRFVPPYPGLTPGVEETGAGLRLVLACTASHREPLGTVFTVLIPGRRPQVSVAPAGTSIPEVWGPLSELT